MNDSYPVTTRPRAKSDGLFGKLDPALTEQLQFFGAFLRQPARVGSLVPSSPALARAMLDGCDLKNAKTVVEFGPGTGAFTRLILEGIGRHTTLLALELDDGNAHGLRRRFPGLNIYHDSAENVPKYLAEHRRKKADYIISGLPWANMPVTAQEGILEAVLNSLAPDGMFTTFAYAHARWLPGARNFRQRLRKYFPDIRTSRIIWCNFPPAFIYRCRLREFPETA